MYTVDTYMSNYILKGKFNIDFTYYSKGNVMISRIKNLLPVICLLCFKAFTNPLPSTLISEIQVETPQKWKIELNRWFLSNEQSEGGGVYNVKLITSRYPDTFSIRLKLETTDQFPVIVPDSIKKSSSKPTVVEMQIGDTVKVGQSFFDIFVIIRHIGADSSLCVCKYGWFVSSDTPSIGAENRIPNKSVTVLVLSNKDTLPVPGLGLYLSDEFHVAPYHFRDVPQGPFSLTVTACEGLRYSIRTKNLHSFGEIHYSYSPLLPDTDTVFVDPVSIKEMHTKAVKSNAKMLTVVNSERSLIFVIRNEQTMAGSGKIRITTVSGKLIQEIAVNVAQTGTSTIAWNKTDSNNRFLSGGIYLATLTVNGRSVTEKFTLGGSFR